jgi:hypothetical protein
VLGAAAAPIAFYIRIALGLVALLVLIRLTLAALAAGSGAVRRPPDRAGTPVSS